jgi:hypothetical protein
MTEGVDFVAMFSVKEYTDTLRKLPTDNATKQGLRKAARKFVQAQRRGAPVRRGTLKKSIHQSKQIKRRGLGEFSVNAGPMTRGRVKRYRGIAEGRYSYSAKAYAESVAASEEIYRSTYESALRRGGLI